MFSAGYSEAVLLDGLLLRRRWLWLVETSEASEILLEGGAYVLEYLVPVCC